MMNKSAHENMAHRLLLEGYTKIGAEGFRGEGGVFVPMMREKELTSFLLASREAIAQAELTAQRAADVAVLQANLAAAASTAESDDFQSSDDFYTDFDDGEIQVPCIFEVDVLAQKLAAESNLKVAERDRNNAMKALTKNLSSRPMTRKIGMPPDIEAAMQELSKLAPQIPELVKCFRVPLLVAQATGSPPMMRPILLVGGPGIGKTHTALQLAGVLGVPSHVVNYGPAGAGGNSLSGSDKSWGNSTTGAVFDILSQGQFANPLIVLEEIDKAASSTTMSGIDRNPLNELLTLLEHTTACVHLDRSAEIRVDARHIMWIATANSLAGFSAPLLSRFQVIHVKPPGAREAVAIALSVAQAVTRQMGANLKAPSGEVLQFLAGNSARVTRQIWTNAGGQAFLNGRTEVTMSDIEQSIGVIPKSGQKLH